MLGHRDTGKAWRLILEGGREAAGRTEELDQEAGGAEAPETLKSRVTNLVT